MSEGSLTLRIAGSNICERDFIINIATEILARSNYTEINCNPVMFGTTNTRQVHLGKDRLTASEASISGKYYTLILRILKLNLNSI